MCLLSFPEQFLYTASKISKFYCARLALRFFLNSLKFLQGDPVSALIWPITSRLMAVKLRSPMQMNSWDMRPSTRTFSILSRGLRQHMLITLSKLRRLVFLGICSTMFLLNCLKWFRMSESFGTMISSSQRQEYSEMSIPPQGGQISTASTSKGFSFRASLLRMVSWLSPLPQTLRLFFSMRIFQGSISLTTSCWKSPAACTATPPTPQKGSSRVLTPYCWSRPHRYREMGSAMTEYQLSVSSWIPESNRVKQKYRLAKYFLIYLVMLQLRRSSWDPQVISGGNSKGMSCISKYPDLMKQSSSMRTRVSVGKSSQQKNSDWPFCSMSLQEQDIFIILL